jgi:hypothetical protein
MAAPLVARGGLHYNARVNAGIAQLVEQLICNQQVVGSNPSAGSSLSIDSYCPSQERPSVKIWTWLPLPSGFTKMVNVAPARFRLRIEDCG